MGFFISVTKSCGADEWDCGNRTCIPLTQRCDGVPHCPNGSDEECGEFTISRLALHHLSCNIRMKINEKMSHICAYKSMKQIN